MLGGIKSFSNFTESMNLSSIFSYTFVVCHLHEKLRLKRWNCYVIAYWVLYDDIIIDDLCSISESESFVNILPYCIFRLYNFTREKRCDDSFMDVMSQLFGVQIKLNIDIKKNECEVPIEINIYIFKHECFYLCNVVVVAKISLHFIFRLDM